MTQPHGHYGPMLGFEAFFNPYNFSQDPGRFMGMFPVVPMPVGSPHGIQVGSSHGSGATPQAGIPSPIISVSSKRSMSSMEDTACSSRKRVRSKADEGKRSKGVPNKVWRKEHDDVLIPFLANQVRKGMKIHKTSKRQAFTAAIVEINNKFGENFTTNNVVNHMKSLRSRYMNICKCLDLSGAGWDEEKQMITLDPTSYESQREGNSKIEQYVNKPLQHFKDLRAIIGDDFAKGAFKKAVSDQFGASPDEEGYSEGAKTSSRDVVDVDSPVVDTPPSDSPVASSQNAPKRGGTPRHTSTSKKGSKSRSQDDVIVTEMRAIAKEVSFAIQYANMHWTEKLSMCIHKHEGEFPERALDHVLETLIQDELKSRLFIVKSVAAQKRRIIELMESSGQAYGGGEGINSASNEDS